MPYCNWFDLKNVDEVDYARDICDEWSFTYLSVWPKVLGIISSGRILAAIAV